MLVSLLNDANLFDVSQYQGWAGYSIRLRKLAKSVLLLGDEKLKRSVNEFALALRSKYPTTDMAPLPYTAEQLRADLPSHAGVPRLPSRHAVTAVADHSHGVSQLQGMRHQPSEAWTQPHGHATAESPNDGPGPSYDEPGLEPSDPGPQLRGPGSSAWGPHGWEPTAPHDHGSARTPLYGRTATAAEPGIIEAAGYRRDGTSYLPQTQRLQPHSSLTAKPRLLGHQTSAMRVERRFGLTKTPSERPPWR